LRRRLEAIDADEMARRKSLEEELKGLLPQGAVVTVTESKGWSDADSVLAVRAKVVVEGYAGQAGKRVLLPGLVSDSKREQLFQQPVRENPVHFAYPLREVDVAEIELPQDMDVEASPSTVWEMNEYAHYKRKVSFAPRKLLIERDFAVNGILYPQRLYDGLREFYGKVARGDRERWVLRSHETVN